jgi:N-acetylneuraminic acid mutarotase
MAHDEVSGRLILFGGAKAAPDGPDQFNTEMNDTWAYDSRTNTWTELKTRGSPEARVGAQMFFDQASGKLVLCGGCGSDRVFSDAWTFSF